MMKCCIYCGKKLNGENKYCDNCGKKFKKVHKKIIIIVLNIIGILLLLISIYLVIKYINYKIEQNNYYKNINNIVKNNLYSEIASDDYNLNLDSTKNCIKCVADCDGSCFGYKNDKDCTVFEYTVKDSDLEYKVYLVEKNIESGKSYTFFSSREKTNFYNDILARTKKDFSEFEIKSKFDYSILSVNETINSECSINLYTSKSFNNVFNEELYNKLISFSKDRIGECSFDIQFGDDKKIEFGYHNNNINIYNRVDNRFIFSGDTIEISNITYEEFMMEVGNRGW